MAIVEEVKEESEITVTVENLKKEGNEKFGQGDWPAAAEKYKEALNICPTENSLLRSVLLSNLSAAYIKQSLWEAAAESATEAITANAPNEKPLERRAFAYSNIPEKYQNAVEDYEKLKEQFPQRIHYQNKIRELQKRIEVRNEEMKNEMIAKLKQIGKF
ncbi:tetratricopeptide repeat protein [Oesophagostomum dentatum]|uniref:Tetratricopeptide repeat protein n=1 Tax=Oesophagostomum dentatum TaxID=61180 RepID=A0A0B1T8M9_OESDE|nr:tetratricopeptide repeat protein [Oesophagostomum dentatum]